MDIHEFPNLLERKRALQAFMKMGSMYKTVYTT